MIEELNRRSLVLCPDNVTIADANNSIFCYELQQCKLLHGINYDVTIRAQVMGCGDTINANIAAEVVSRS